MKGVSMTVLTEGLTDKYSDHFTTETLQELIASQQSPCVSIYLPMERKGAETQQNAIRLKNLQRQAAAALAEWADDHADAMKNLNADQLLKPVADLVENRPFMQQQSVGLAIFIAQGTSQIYRLPLAFEERVVVGDSFWLKPLLPLLTGNGTFYLLTLNQGGVQFLRGTREALSPVELSDDIPRSLEAALRYDEFEPNLQFHTQTGMNTDSGDRAAMFHGHGGADEVSDAENILRFFRALDNGVRDLLEGGSHPPLVLAGVSFLQGLYRQVNQYNNLVDEGIDHDPTATTLAELHRQSWQIVLPHFQQAQSQATAQYEHLRGTNDQRAMSAVEEIVAAAYFQRVDTLFLLANSPIWGTFDMENNQVQIHNTYHPGDKELINFAAMHTFLNGGTVYDISEGDMSENGAGVTSDSAMAALLRY
jgi:hypothetical protein